MFLDYALIGKRIADRRKELKLTQAELAERIGLSDKFISSIETASSIPSLDTVAQISCVLNIKSDFILFGVEDKSKNDIIIEIMRHLITSNKQELTDFLCNFNDFKNIS